MTVTTRQLKILFAKTTETLQDLVQFLVTFRPFEGVVRLVSVVTRFSTTAMVVNVHHVRGVIQITTEP